MTPMTLATSEADARAVEAVEAHHAELAGSLTTLVARLVDAASRGEAATADEARTALVRFSRDELIPHAAAAAGDPPTGSSNA